MFWANAAIAIGALETPKPGDPLFAGNAVHLIATPQQSLQAAVDLARAAGLDAHILSDEMEGDSRDGVGCMRRWHLPCRARASRSLDAR